MTVTPADVHNVAFNKPSIAKRGYDAADVDAFLDELERELIRLIEENNQLLVQMEHRSLGGTPGRPAADPQLAAELGHLKAQLDRVQAGKVAAEQAVRAMQAELEQMRAQDGPFVDGDSRQQALQVLTMAQRTADDHVGDARREADKILSDARSTAEEVTRQAQFNASALERKARQRHQAATDDVDAKRSAAQKHIEELKELEREYRTQLKAYLEGQLRDLGGRGNGSDTATTQVDSNQSAASPRGTDAPTPTADPGS
jgi:DivIVA domain-containing protein